MNKICWEMDDIIERTIFHNKEFRKWNKTTIDKHIIKICMFTEKFHLRFHVEE